MCTRTNSSRQQPDEHRCDPVCPCLEDLHGWCALAGSRCRHLSKLVSRCLRKRCCSTKSKELKDCVSVHAHQTSASALAGLASQREIDKPVPEPVCVRGGAHKRTPRPASPTAQRPARCHTHTRATPVAHRRTTAGRGRRITRQGQPPDHQPAQPQTAQRTCKRRDWHSLCYVSAYGADMHAFTMQEEE